MAVGTCTRACTPISWLLRTYWRGRSRYRRCRIKGWVAVTTPTPPYSEGLLGLRTEVERTGMGFHTSSLRRGSFSSEWFRNGPVEPSCQWDMLGSLKGEELSRNVSLLLRRDVWTSALFWPLNTRRIGCLDYCWCLRQKPEAGDAEQKRWQSRGTLIRLSSGWMYPYEANCFQLFVDDNKSLLKTSWGVILLHKAEFTISDTDYINTGVF